MRLRRLSAAVIMLAVLPLGLPATPALAETPAPTPPPPAATAEPSPAEPAPVPETPEPAPTPEQKLQEGLAVDTGTVRAIVEVTDPGQNAPVAAEAAQRVDVVLQARTQPFVVVEGTAAELAKLAEDPRVTSIRRDRAFPPTLASSLRQIGADQAHAQGMTGEGQEIAILDTGIDRDHPFFKDRVVAEACFSAVDTGVQSLCPNGQAQMIGEGAANVEIDTCMLDGVNLCEHGSHVTGIAAGNGGVAPGARIIAVQVFSRVNDEDTCGEASCILAFESSLLEAMGWVAGQAGARPIAAVNLSLGGWPMATACDTTEEGAAFKAKVDELLSKGAATVVAGGNESFEGASYPACVSSTVAVGANDDADAIADFSNRGPLLDLFAPGVDIESSVPDDQTATHSGTSMAAPHVAGALAVMKAKFPQTPMPELIDKLKASGRPYVYGPTTTPRLDLLAALTGTAQQPPIEQTPGTPDDPGDPDPGGDPDPDPTNSGPTPEPDPDPDADPDPDPDPAPTPIPLPTVTVTVTVTATAPGAVCKRGTATTALSTKQWAVEIHRSSGTIPDPTLNCYLKLVQKGSKVFPELTKASSLGKAYRVLRATSGNRAKLDRALLRGWLNWAHGKGDLTRLQAAEKVRLSATATSAQLKKAAAGLKSI
ncbi:S8 family serine peptidase [Nonomuraea sp. NBC_01738]|uniref:S8 family peptidase n=1 Tax=Nonomuraea sp. NBC_01738 TaxID=2976003 RepID=UPI002E145C83|nr:S8 family serine peptidase [Nonomuraea sp. NBC_01738]